MTNAYKYIMNHGGIEREQDYPYTGTDDVCKFNYTEEAADDVGYILLDDEDEDRMKIMLLTQGPLAVAIDANHTDFFYFEDGIYWNSECGTTIDDVDHAVLVVGYGTDPWSNQDYWNVKNSWGTSWGDEGYFKMARNAGNMCAIASFVSFPLVYDGVHFTKVSS